MPDARIEISPEFDRWVNGMDRLSRQDPLALQRWNESVRSLYEAADRVVHVITGDLKRPGHVNVRITQDELIGEVIYDTDYAIYEHARGGEHAFLDRAWEETSREFEQFFDTMFTEVFRPGVFSAG